MNRIRLWTCQNVADFAIATLQLMPQGEEPGQLDLDAELERLTA
jgi:hypothetical protein